MRGDQGSWWPDKRGSVALCGVLCKDRSLKIDSMLEDVLCKFIFAHSPLTSEIPSCNQKSMYLIDATNYKIQTTQPLEQS